MTARHDIRALWVRSIDAGWAGPVADQAKRHAARIAGSLARHLLGTTWEPTPAAVDAFADPTPGRLR